MYFSPNRFKIGSKRTIFAKTRSDHLFLHLGKETLNWGLYASLTSFFSAPASFLQVSVPNMIQGMAHTGT
jgi:hypothetical protein